MFRKFEYQLEVETSNAEEQLVRNKVDGYTKMKGPLKWRTFYLNIFGIQNVLKNLPDIIKI